MMCKHYEYNIYCDEHGNLFKNSGKQIKPQYKGKYPCCTFYNKGHRVTKAVHRLVAECWNGAPVETVHHCNHDTNDYRPANLANVTRQAHNLIEVKGWSIESNLFDKEG